MMATAAIRRILQMMPSANRYAWAAGLCLGLSVCTLSACATQAGPGDPGAATIADGQAFSMHPGEVVALADRSTLRYVHVGNDSRCPPGVQCIWAGDAEVGFAWSPASGAPTDFTLHTGKEPRTHDFDGHRLTLVSLERGPAPAAQLRLDAAP
jgi:hypothetical protein